MGMDVPQFYATIAAVVLGNGLFLSLLYAAREFDKAKSQGRGVPWKIIGLGCVCPTVAALSAYFFVTPY